MNKHFLNKINVSEKMNEFSIFAYRGKTEACIREGVNVSSAQLKG